MISNKGKTALLAWIVFVVIAILDVFFDKLTHFETAMIFMMCCLIDVLAVKE